MDLSVHTSTTGAGIHAYMENKKKSSEFIRAKMVGNKEKICYELTLFDDTGNALTIVSGLTAGYTGEGPRGTLKVLRDVGFQGEDIFVEGNTSFDIHKAD